MIFTYIDPGSGSLIFQLLLAGILGVLTFFKNIKLFFLAVFKIGKQKNNQDLKDGDERI